MMPIIHILNGTSTSGILDVAPQRGDTICTLMQLKIGHAKAGAEKIECSLFDGNNLAGAFWNEEVAQNGFAYPGHTLNLSTIKWVRGTILRIQVASGDTLNYQVTYIEELIK